MFFFSHRYSFPEGGASRLALLPYFLPPVAIKSRSVSFSRKCGRLFKKTHRLPFSTRRGKHTTLEPRRHTLIDVLHASSPVEAHRESGSRLIKKRIATSSVRLHLCVTGLRPDIIKSILRYCRCQGVEQPRSISLHNRKREGVFFGRARNV